MTIWQLGFERGPGMKPDLGEALKQAAVIEERDRIN